MNEIQLAEESIRLLRQEEITRNRYATNINWLQERIEMWQASSIRVGVIGVTSSGKSTLINALLAEELLPTAVRPSSSRLVTCQKGMIKQANIYFEDSREMHRITGKKVNSKALTKYGDEAFNPNNEKKVKQIEIITPQFALDEEIMLIDSPGLDAYNLETHERLTMEVLLPTIDVCIFVTTLKANTDETTLRLINAIEKHQKPLIIVQNMLDSVEPKRGKMGRILKTKEEVAQEHRLRVERIIKKSNLKNKALVEIIQVSAKLGLQSITHYNKEKWQQSRMPELIQIVNKRVSALQPNISKQRYVQLLSHIKREIIDTSDLETGEQKINPIAMDEVSELDLVMKELCKQYKLQKEKVETMAEAMIQSGGRINSQINNLSEEGMSTCKGLLGQLKQELDAHQNDIIKQIDWIGNHFDKVFDRFNLNKGEYYYKKPAIKSMSQLHMHTKSITKTRRVEKTGFSGKVGRFFGGIFGNNSMGYTYQNYEDEVLDKAETMKMVTSMCLMIAEAYEETIRDWSEKNSTLLDILEAELLRRKEQQEAMKKYLLDKEKNKQLIHALCDLTNRIQVQVNRLNKIKVKAAQVQEANRTFEAYSTVEVPNLVMNIHELADKIISQVFQITYEAVHKANKRRVRNLTGNIIWAWDLGSLESFTQRFMNDTLRESEVNKLRKEGLLVKESFMLVYEPSLTKKSDKQLNEVLYYIPCTLNVLVNGIQLGASCKQLAESRLRELADSEKRVVNIILQSLGEFIVNRELDEVIPALFEIRKMLPNALQGYLLINDANPFYSLVLVELQQRDEITLADETEIIKFLQDNFNDLIDDNLHVIATIIASYTKERSREKLKRA